MTFLYDFPKNAAFGKVLPKNKIYEHALSTPAVKKMFVREVEKIVWSYKLSPETINLPAKENIQEIQVFTITLKRETLGHGVLSVIDRAIPSPIFFILGFENKTRYAAAYKRQNESDKSRWVVGNYFETNWIPDDACKVPLPVVLDLGSLYHALLKSIIPLSVRQNETLYELVSRSEKLKIREREAAFASIRLKNEKQFNRRVEINAELRNLKKIIEELNR